MRAIVRPGGVRRGTVQVPGDKSIAHRWLILAAIAEGRSRLVDVPHALDVRSTAGCLMRLVPSAASTLDLWASGRVGAVEGGGSTWNASSTASQLEALEVEGEGLGGLQSPSSDLDCGNSGTTMRLLAGLLAGRPFRSTLTGDESLRARPMERVADPLRRMGAEITSVDGHAPLTVRGGTLHGLYFVPSLPSAQVKSAVLLAGLSAEGSTSVKESVTTRDHTERALQALGVPCIFAGGTVTLHPAPFTGFDARVPGDLSSSAFLIAAAAVSGTELEVARVGLNPSRLHILDVLSRMGVEVSLRQEGTEVGEPVGRLAVSAPAQIRGITVTAEEVPLVIDEIPILASLAAHADGQTRFEGAGELRVKESDRLSAVATGIVGLGGDAREEGDDLVVVGGGLRGGAASSHGDHRMAMSLVIAALAADSASTIEGIEAADVSFPGFVSTLQAAGADIEVVR